MFFILIFFYPGGFFYEISKLLGRKIKQFIGHALRNHPKRTVAHPRLGQKLFHIRKPDFPAVQHVGIFAAFIHLARHHCFAKTEWAGFASEIKIHGHAGAGQRIAPGRAVKNQILAFFAAQILKALLGQSPANGVHHIGFARTVGAGYHRDAFGKIQNCFFGERLETGKF